MQVPRAWDDDDITAMLSRGDGGRLRAREGDCIMHRQAWETKASAGKVSASRFQPQSKESQGFKQGRECEEGHVTRGGTG